MLSRSSSDAGTRLRRSRSNATVHHRPSIVLGLPDPQVNKQQAVAAAQAAYGKVRVDEMTEKIKSVDRRLQRTKSSASRKSLGSQEGSHFPPRESSRRSMQPARLGQQQKQQQQQSISRQIRPPTASGLEKFPAFLNTPLVQTSGPPHAGLGANENARPSSQPRPHQAGLAYSVNSQQIRKARSMYGASQILTGSPLPRTQVQASTYLTTPASSSSAPEQSLFSSRSHTIVPSSVPSPRVVVTVAQGESINDARDKFLQEHSRSVRKKPSRFLAPFKKRQDKIKEKPDAPVVPPSASGEAFTRSQISVFEPPADTATDFRGPKERRSISNSLRDKFRKVFRRSSNPAVTLPNQQVEAQRDYFNYPSRGEGSFTASRSPSCPRADSPVPSPDPETLRRFTSRTPSSDVEQPASSAARSVSRNSARSLHSEGNTSQGTRSRVTSWGTSSVGGTIVQQDESKKRMTVIHEVRESISIRAGQSIAVIAPLFGSSGLSRRKSGKPLAASLDPPASSHIDMASENQYTSMESQPPSMEMPTIAEASRQSNAGFFGLGAGQTYAVAETTITITDGDAPVGPLPYPQPPNLVLHDFVGVHTIIWGGDNHPNEAYSVPDDRSSSVPSATLSQRPGTAEPLIAAKPSVEEVADERTAFTTVESSTRRRDAPLVTNTSQVVTPTATQIETRVKRSEDRWRSQLDEHEDNVGSTQRRKGFSITKLMNSVNNAIHPRSSKNPTERGTSVRVGAQRQATEVDDEPYTVCHETPRAETPKTETPKSKTPKSGKIKRLFSPMSPSIYSRNTDGVSVAPTDSNTTLARDSRESASGTATITTPSTKVKTYTIGRPLNFVHLAHGSASDEDARKHECHGSSAVERTPAKPTIAGHHREAAQIDGHGTSSPIEHLSPPMRVVHVCKDDSGEIDSSVLSDLGEGDTILPSIEQHYEVFHPESVSSAAEHLTSSPDRGDDSGQQEPSKLSLPSPEEPVSSFPDESTSVFPDEPSSFPIDLKTPVPKERTPLFLEDSRTYFTDEPSQLFTDEPDTARRVSPRPPLSSVPNQGSPSARAPSYEMNHSYPMINTGRNSRASSAQNSQTAHSTPNSGSSRISKTTPSPHVYSDYSTPMSSRRRKTHEPQAKSKLSNPVGNCKENVSNVAHSNPSQASAGRPSGESTSSKNSKPVVSTQSRDSVLMQAHPSHRFGRASHDQYLAAERNIDQRSSFGNGVGALVQTSAAAMGYVSVQNASLRTTPNRSAQSHSPATTGIRSAHAPTIRPLRPQPSADDFPRRRYAIVGPDVSENTPGYPFVALPDPVENQQPSFSPLTQIQGHSEQSIWDLNNIEPNPSVPSDSFQTVLDGPFDERLRSPSEPAHARFTPRNDRGTPDRALVENSGRRGSPARASQAYYYPRRGPVVDGRDTPGQRMGEEFLLERQAPSGAGSPESSPRIGGFMVDHPDGMIRFDEPPHASASNFGEELGYAQSMEPGARDPTVPSQTQAHAGAMEASRCFQKEQYPDEYQYVHQQSARNTQREQSRQPRPTNIPGFKPYSNPNVTSAPEAGYDAYDQPEEPDRVAGEYPDQIPRRHTDAYRAYALAHGEYLDPNMLPNRAVLLHTQGDQEQLENQRIEKQRIEKERLQHQRREKYKREKERREKQKLEKEKLEKQKDGDLSPAFI
ncbi:hypothetical protein EJ04DRAFT_337436 [Polyplosphaeria fusca]|uniref:Uncharacterized protein n=1 Tax=Polyplosphaeria fusca TaxID=682080 RepID=A0A9P4UXP3_9PLEO|nr:hypothetical protein EJ04DRAFT_337436 [Polyplosphaeria fusca]